LGRNRGRRYSSNSIRNLSQFRAAHTHSRATWLGHLVDSNAFGYWIGAVILVNGVMIGVQTDYMARNNTTSVPRAFDVAEIVFCIVFTVELALRIYWHRWDFFFGTEKRWNIFDAFVILLQLAEQVARGLVYSADDANLSEYSDGTGILRILRICRLMRIVRVLRIVHMNGELQAIVAAVSKGLRSFYWTVTLLILLMYVVGVFFTQCVTDHKVTSTAGLEDLEEYYGSLPSTMLALFQSVTDGKEWREMLTPLMVEISPLMAVPFCMYISFVSFALMNILTGIFVDRALESGKEEKRRFLLQEVRAVFLEGDSEKMTWPEFQAQLENPHMQMLFDALDVDEEDAEELFHVLDAQQTGSIEAEEFVNGCLRLDGPTKAVDFAAFAEEQRRLNRISLAHARFVNSSLLSIMNHLEKPRSVLDPAASIGAEALNV